MKKEHTEYLFRTFSFFHPEASLHESLMCFGFECGDGWFALIKTLCEHLTALQLGKQFRVVQVKEKFGGLRFYVGNIPTAKANEAYALIDDAEGKSFEICELCGKPGTLHDDGWMMTRCNTCWKNRNAPRCSQCGAVISRKVQDVADALGADKIHCKKCTPPAP